jgi:hypothetical protein
MRRLSLFARDGRIYYGRTQATLPQIREQVRGALSTSFDKKIFLRPDARARNGDVNVVIDELRAGGVMNVGILTEKLRAPNPQRWRALLFLRVGDEFADRDEAESELRAGGENFGKGAESGRGVGDAVMEDDDGARDEIFGDEPADVGVRRVRGIVRVGAAEGGRVAEFAGAAELSGAGDAAGRAKEFRRGVCGGRRLRVRRNGVCAARDDWRDGGGDDWREAEGAFDVEECAREFIVGVREHGAFARVLVVVAEFVAVGADSGDDFRVALGAIADQEEGGVGIVRAENFEDARRLSGVRAVIEGQRDERRARADAVEDLRREAFEQRHAPQRLRHKDVREPRDGQR